MNRESGPKDGSSATMIGHATRQRFASLVKLLVCFLLVYLYVNAFRSTIIDDAFIQFQYADTLTRHGTWGFFPGHATNTATSALNVLLLAGITLLTGSTVTAAILLTALLLLLLFIILQNLSCRIFGNSFFALFLFFALLANPLLLSTLGMEVMLFVVLWVASLSLFIFHRWRWLALSLALLTLARPDGFLLFLMLFILAAISSIETKEKLLLFAIYILLLLPWEMYAWLRLGSLVPDTLLIKMAQGAWHGDASFGSGLVSLYFFRFPVEMVFSFLLLPFTFFALRNSDPNARSLARIAIGYGVIHYIAYSALKVPPYHWYYAHLVLGVVIAGSVGAAVIARHLRRSRYLLLIIPLSAILYIASDGIPISEAPIHTNWATHEQYRQFAEWIRQNTDPSNTFIMAGEIGTLAYYSDRTLLNNFSNQWSLQRLLIQKFNRESEWKRRLFRWNFLFRKEAVRYRHSTYRIDHVLHPHVPRTDRGVIYYRHTSTKWIPDGVLYVRKTGQQ